MFITAIIVASGALFECNIWISVSNVLATLFIWIREPIHKKNIWMFHWLATMTLIIVNSRICTFLTVSITYRNPIKVGFVVMVLCWIVPNKVSSDWKLKINRLHCLWVVDSNVLILKTSLNQLFYWLFWYIGLYKNTCVLKSLLDVFTKSCKCLAVALASCTKSFGVFQAQWAASVS